MAANVQKVDLVDIELNKGNIARNFLNHSIGMADNKADAFGVRVFRDGQPVTLTSVSVQGYFRDPHGNNIGITSGNTVSENTAYVVLPQACYNYEGQFCLAIKLIGGGVTGTMRIVDGMVDNTHTGGAITPAPSVATYDEVLAGFTQAMAVIEASVRYDEPQSKNATEKAQARANIDAVSTTDAVRFDGAQTNDDFRKAQARANIDATNAKDIAQVYVPAAGYRAGDLVLDPVFKTLYRIKATTAKNTEWSTSLADKVDLGGELTSRTDDLNSALKSIASFENMPINVRTNQEYPLGYRSGYYTSANGSSYTSTNYSRTIYPLPVIVGGTVIILATSNTTIGVCVFSSATPSVSEGGDNSSIFIRSYPTSTRIEFVAQENEYYFLTTDVNYASLTAQNRPIIVSKSLLIDSVHANTDNISMITSKSLVYEELNVSDFVQGYADIMSNTHTTSVSRFHTKYFRSVRKGDCLLYDSRTLKIGVWCVYEGESEVVNIVPYTVTTEPQTYVFSKNVIALLVQFSPVSSSAYITPSDYDATVIFIRKEFEPERLKALIDVTSNVRSINHRGYQELAPENTIPAFKLSSQKGFTWIESDVQFTSDDVPVILHDRSINRTARNQDGSIISTTINIDSITYEQALQYDFGIWFGEEYAGTKIPTFEEVILLCKKLGLKFRIELKSETVTTDKIATLVDIVNRYGMIDCVEWASFGYSLVEYISQNYPSFPIGYIVSSITSTVVSDAKALQTNQNRVIVAASVSNSANNIKLLSDEKIPLDLWTITSIQQIVNASKYASSFTTNRYMVSEVVYNAEI